MLVTLIVPVFNTRSELVERAVISALEQTHEKIEVLIVDDGSATETAQFLDRLARTDPRIRTVHRANGGVSAARNTGLDNARGDYIGYLDADDHLEPHFVSAALATAVTTDADVVFGGIRVLQGTGAVQWRGDGPSAKTPLRGTPDMIITACVHALADSPSLSLPTPFLSVTNVVAALYRARIARTHRFPEGVDQAEDRLYNLHFLLEATCVVFCSDIWYVYDATHDQGATRRATPRTITVLAQTVRAFARVAETSSLRHGISDDARSRIEQAAADGLLRYLKVLTGVIAAASGQRRTNRSMLQDLLTETSVRSSVTQASATGWRDRVFAAAARRRQIRLLLLLGWLWVQSGGLEMTVGAPGHPAHSKEHSHG